MKDKRNDKNEHKVNGAGEVVAAYNAVAARFHRRLDRLEQFLKLNLPCVPIANRARADIQRVVLGWDGVRVILLRAADLPPPRGEDLAAALDGLVDDVREALRRAAIAIPATEAALSKSDIGVA